MLWAMSAPLATSKITLLRAFGVSFVIISGGFGLFFDPGGRPRGRRPLLAVWSPERPLLFSSSSLTWPLLLPVPVLLVLLLVGVTLPPVTLPLTLPLLALRDSLRKMIRVGPFRFSPSTGFASVCLPLHHRFDMFLEKLEMFFGCCVKKGKKKVELSECLR